MLERRIIDEIKQIPSHKLPEVYDFIHHFRLGLELERQSDKPEQSFERQPGSLLRLGQSLGNNYRIPDDFNAPMADLRN